MEVKLIEAVRCFPCLWQVSNPSYKDARARQSAWIEVASEVGELSVDECMKRWKNLRDRFVRELKKAKKNDDDEGAVLLHSSWPFFDFLLFLQDSVRHRKTKLTGVPQVSELNPDLRSGDLPLASLASTDFSTGVLLSELDSPVLATTRQSEVKRRKISSVDHAILKCLKHFDEKQPQQRVLDEEELFGMHIAAVLRRLTNRQKAMARLKIQQVLTDVEFPETSLLPNVHDTSQS